MAWQRESTRVTLKMGAATSFCVGYQMRAPSQRRTTTCSANPGQHAASAAGLLMETQGRRSIRHKSLSEACNLSGTLCTTIQCPVQHLAGSGYACSEQPRGDSPL